MDKRPVECIANFDVEGNIKPVRIRFEDTEGQHVIDINKVLEKDIKNGFGHTSGSPSILHSFKCQSVIEGMAIQFKLQYETKGCTWHMLQ